MVARPCPLLPNLQSALGLAWMRGPAPARGSQQARSVAAVRGICARNLCSTDQHGTEPATATAVHSASAFFDHHSVCGGFHYPRASLARHMDFAWAVGTYQIRLSPRPRQRLHRIHSVSPCQSSSLHSPPIPVLPPPPGRHRPVRDTSLELGQDGDPNGLGRTATIDWPWYLPWPIADASYI